MVTFLKSEHFLFYMSVINQMMYRVFLHDEKDMPDHAGNLGNSYRIRSREILAYCFTAPAWRPSLDEQVEALGCGGSRVEPSPESIDGHWLIEHDGSTIGVAHSLEELPEKAYVLAKDRAIKMVNTLSDIKGRPYIFIDVTSRGNRKQAEKLSNIICEEEVYGPEIRSDPSKVADIGD